MSDQYLGEIRLFAGNFVPVGWLACDGAKLSVGDYAALYHVLGLTWGGEADNYFCLPDLRGRVCVGVGQNSTSDTTYAVGQLGGTESVQLTLDQIPQHSHLVRAQARDATTAIPGGKVTWATTPMPPQHSDRGGELSSNDKEVPSADLPKLLYDTAVATVPMAAEAISVTGGDQAHDNMQPSIALTYIIATTGIHPIPSAS